MCDFVITSCDSDTWKHFYAGTLRERESESRRMASKSILRRSNVTKTEYAPLDVHLQRRAWKCCPFSPHS